MAVNQKFSEYRVNSLPSSGLQAGDRYYLSVGGGKYKTFIVSDNLVLTGDAGAEFIEKDTMAQMRALSSREIWALQNGYYKGVRLSGYYTKGDTPAPIVYTLSETTDEDDGGSVIEVGGIKLEHEFIGNIDIRYFGASTNLDVINNDIFINKLIQYSFVHKNVIEVPEGEFFVSDSIKGIPAHALKMVGRGINVSRISAAVEMDVLLDLGLSSNANNIEIRGITFNGKRLTNKTAYMNNCHHFRIDDVRFQGGDIGLEIGSSWCYDLNKVTCIYNRIGGIIYGQTDVNNNGTIRSSGFFLNDEIGLILVAVRDMKFSNTVIEANKKLGLYIGGATRGLSLDSMYIEFNGDEGIDINYVSGIETRYNQIIVNGGGAWLGEGPINTGREFTPHTISFNNMMIVKSSSGINKDTINVLNGESIYVNSCWSGNSVNLVVFKDSQLTSLNNLSTNNNFNIGGGEVLKTDYTNTQVSSRSNAKTWYLGEVSDTVVEDIPLDEYTLPANVNMYPAGTYLGYDVMDIEVTSSSALNVRRVLSQELLSSKKLYYSILYKSEGIFNIVTEEGGVRKVKNFAASPDDFAEATIVLPESPEGNVTVSIGIYAGVGTVSVTKPEVGVIGNPKIKPNFLKVASTTVKGLVNQATASTDSAPSVGETYSQSEVQAILNELRDLKAKMRSAGLLAN